MSWNKKERRASLIYKKKPLPPLYIGKIIASASLLSYLYPI